MPRTLTSANEFDGASSVRTTAPLPVLDAAEAPTPVISNRCMMSTVPIMELPPTPFLSDKRHRENPRKARFSSSREPPIVVNRPLSESGEKYHRRKSRKRQTKKEYSNELMVSSSRTWDYSSPLWAPVVVSTMYLLPAAWRRLWHYATASPPKVFRPLVRTTMITQSSSPSSTAAGGAAKEHSGQIRGLKNYGQTCFLNAVLQSLASLESFIAYLDRILEMHRLYHNKEVTTTHSHCFTELLLNTLRFVNGWNETTSHVAADPRKLLEQIGEKHSQFKAKYGLVGKEQQDAEELLQALIQMIVEEADLERSSSTVPSAFCSNSSFVPIEDEEESLTVVSGIRERLRMKDAEIIGKTIGDHCPKEGKRRTTLNGMDSSSLGDHARPHYVSRSPQTADAMNLRREEKKQDEFELTIPRVNSEDDLRPFFPLESVDTAVSDRLEIVSDISSRDRALSAAMQIMLSTTSSISPSPLGGWMGSALQCSECKHVRAIQNAPFFDIPVVPTSVSRYLSAPCHNSPGDPPTKCSPTSPVPPCRLEQCLDEFTHVERVQEVECRECTLIREVQHLESEVQTLQEVISGLVARAQRRGVIWDEDSNAEHLKTELAHMQAKLRRLKTISSDDDVEWEKPVLEGTDFATDGRLSDLHLKRSDAFKCLLLTRLPPVLIIHVQRRFYDPLTNRMTKTTQHVSFSEVLNIAPYCVGGGNMEPLTQWSSKNSRVPKEDPAPVHYRIMSVIEHRGSAFYGHYVCYRRDPQTGRWLYISDDLVKTVDWEDVRVCQAYMLFYEAL